MKQKKCKYCGELFTPFNSLQNFCFKNECITEHNQKQKEKKKRKELSKLNNEDKNYLIKIAQSTFNTYIRMRDKDLPCISCGTVKKIQYHAGHYRPVGRNSALRFNDDNCHKQCSVCNNHLSGNLIQYRIALIEKIGLEKVEFLENFNEPKKWSIEEIKEIIKTYKKKIKNI